MIMKKSVWLWGLLVLGLLLALPTAGSAATLNVTNGGFENGFANWTQKYAAGEMNSFHSQGTSSLKLLNGSTAQAGYESEMLEARPGVVYTAKVKSYVTSGSGLLILQFYKHNPSGPGFIRISQTVTTNSTIGSGGVWTSMSVPATAPSDAEYVNLMLYTNSGTVYFDEAEIDAATQVVNGTVVLAESQPASSIAGVTVNLYALADRLYQTPLATGTTTDSSGSFRLYTSNQPSGTYVLRAVKNQYAESVNITIDSTGKSGVQVRLGPNADTYFTNSPGWFRNYVPGVINPNEGTIELKVEIDRPYKEFGSDYDFVFKMAPRKSIGNTLLAMYMPTVSKPSAVDSSINNPSLTPLESFGLSALVRNQLFGSPSVRLSATDAGFKSRYNLTTSKTHMLAMTWAQNQPLRLYVDGSETANSGSTVLQNPLNSELLPYQFQAALFSPFKTKAIRISTKALTSLNGNPGTDFTTVSDTSLLSNDMTIVQRYKSTNMSGYSTVMPADRPEIKSFVAGEPVIVPFVSINHANTDQTYTVTINATNEKGSVAGAISGYTITVPGDSRQRIHEIPFAALNGQGYYSLDITVTNASGTIVAYTSAVSVLPANDASVTDGALQSFYGQNYSREFDPSVMTDMNVKTTRSWGDGAQMFAWRSIEPQNDQWNWTAADRYVDYSVYAGMDVLGLLGNAPRWAAQRPVFNDGTGVNADKVKVTDYSVLPERWVPVSTNDYEEWREYVRETALHFKDRVKYWEIYNEANFHYVASSSTPVIPESFTGTSTQYFDLLKAAYEEVQTINANETSVNPGFVPIKILTSGFSSSFDAADKQMPTDLLNSSTYGSKYDIFNVHGYSGASAVSIWSPPTSKDKWMTEQAWLTDTAKDRRLFKTVESYFDFLGNGYKRFYNFGLTTFFFDRYTFSPQPDYYVAGVFQNRMRKANSYVGTLSFTGSSSFSIKHAMQRTDGTYLSVIGSKNGGYDIKLNNPASQIVKVTDLYGRDVAKKSGSPETYNTGIDNLLYIVSTQPLSIQDNPELTQIGDLIVNGDFQDIGDPFAGLSNTKPSGWNYNNSPGNGTITVVETSTGNYAMQIAKNSTGANLFLSQDVSIPKPGTYRLSADFKQVGTISTYTAWAFFKNRDDPNPSTQTISTTVPGTGLSTTVYTTLTVPNGSTLSFSSVLNNAVVGFGIYGSQPGTIIIDNVKLAYLGP